MRLINKATKVAITVSEAFGAQLVASGTYEEVGKKPTSSTRSRTTKPKTSKTASK